MKNLLIAQSGGPTSAINATLAGILQVAQTSSQIDKIYGAINGIQGVLDENFLELGKIIKDTNMITLLCQTPSAALGSCRFKLDNLEKNELQYQKILEIFRKYHIQYFIYIGGNDSMDTVNKLSIYFLQKGIKDIMIMGAPKTIDNDLTETDHCPGFGCAAKYIATTFCELERDISVYPTRAVTIVEVMGRNAGWLTAASSLSRLNGGRGPSLIYLCETDFCIEQFIEAVNTKIREESSIIVAVSEGIHDKEKNYISDQIQGNASDVFGHKYIAGAGRILENIVRKKIGCKVRSIELNLMQRSAAHIASKTDINESRILGMKALQRALEGGTGEMASIYRNSSIPYDISFTTVPVHQVANHEKKVPIDFINTSGNDITEKMVEYLKPLIQGEANIQYENGIPKHLVLY